MITFFNNFLEVRSLKLSGNFALLRTTNLTNWISFCKKQTYEIHTLYCMTNLPFITGFRKKN